MADDDVRTLVELPAGAIPNAVVEICGYVDADDGEMKYGLRTDGYTTLSNLLGLLALAGHDLIADRDAEDAED